MRHTNSRQHHHHHSTSPQNKPTRLRSHSRYSKPRLSVRPPSSNKKKQGNGHQATATTTPATPKKRPTAPLITLVPPTNRFDSIPACADIVASVTADLQRERQQLQQQKSNDSSASGIHETTTTSSSKVQSQDGGMVTTRTTVTTKTVGPAKPMSAMAKFRQLDKQNSITSQSPPNSPRTPSTPSTPGATAGPMFQFTDPSLNRRAATVKDQLLQWCQMKTRGYENVKIDNFSTSWSDGMAFCALIHHFLPDAFDFTKLTPQQRRHNFTLAFRVADKHAG